MSAPFFEFRAAVAPRPAGGLYLRYGKRLLDISAVALMLPVVLPLLALILAATALSGGAPLYAQHRVGRDGRVFRMWKVRTMVRNADDLLERLLASDTRLAREWAVRQKLVPDPRVTRLGAILRRTSLDELPQLWNVLDGSMSLVGPRPFTPEQTSLYPGGEGDAAYYRMRPGLTGLWQVGPRSRGSFAERAGHDNVYWSRLSLAGDLAILCRTMRVVLRGTGA